MFTSAVLFQGQGPTRMCKLLTVLSLAQLTATGCVRELDVAPEGQSETSSGTQEPGPGDESDATQGATTTTQGSGESSAVETTSSGAGNETSTLTSGESSSSDEPTQEEDTGDPKEACVKESEDRQCVPKAPVGWFGPVGLLQSSNASDTRVCKAHSGEISELFDEVSAPAAECKGCEPRLEYPESLRAQAVEYSASSCSDSSQVASLPMGDWFCRRLEPDGDGKQAHWKMIAPKVEGELKCVGGNRSSSKLPIVKKNYFRGCEVERKGTCAAQDQVCTKKGVGPTCVYRPGDVACPVEYSARKEVLFAGFEDSRGCGKCEGVMKKQGSWTPQGKISFYQAANCIASSKRRSLDLSELGSRCDSESVRAKKEWNFAQLELTQPKFEGVCETKGWEPEGEVKGKDPVTVCCRGVDEQF